MKRSYDFKKGKRGKHVQRSESDTDLQAGFEVGYLFRGFEEALNTTAAATGGRITALQLAARVGNLLLAKAGGELLHDTKHLSQVRGGASEVDEVPASAAALHVRPRHRKALSRAARRAISVAQKKRWAKAKGRSTSWAKFKTKKARREEMARRIEVREGKRLAA